jgi:hypothetical protein
MAVQNVTVSVRQPIHNTMTTNCPVCCDPYTTIARRPVACAACPYLACLRCTSTFLLSIKTDAHCMNCRAPWDRAFLDSKMTRGFLDGDYKRHRQAVLLDKERSLLPATQPAVEHELECRKKGDLITELGAQSTVLGNQIRELQKKIDVVNHESIEIFLRLSQSENTSELMELKAKRKEFTTLEQTMLQEKFALYHQQDGLWQEIHAHKQFIKRKPSKSKQRREFVAACPSSGCRGFLSTAYKCGTCQEQYCPSCRELKATDKEHTCDPALVATIKAILADSKPCPACGVAISRVSGCDQMYCTQCDTPFSYSTGEKIKGVIHNPHYFERMHQAAANAVAAGGAGGECPAAGVWPRPPQRSPNPYVRSCYHIPVYYQAGLHVQEVVLGEELRLEEPDNTDLRVMFLLKNIDEKTFGQQLQLRDKEWQFKRELRGPLELFVITTLEFFQSLDLDPPTESKVLSNKVSVYRGTVENLINKSLQEISHRFTRQVPQIDYSDGYQAHAYPPRFKKEKSKKVPAAGTHPLPG